MRFELAAVSMLVSFAIIYPVVLATRRTRRSLILAAVWVLCLVLVAALIGIQQGKAERAAHERSLQQTQPAASSDSP